MIRSTIGNKDRICDKPVRDNVQIYIALLVNSVAGNHSNRKDVQPVWSRYTLDPDLIHLWATVQLKSCSSISHGYLLYISKVQRPKDCQVSMQKVANPAAIEHISMC